MKKVEIEEREDLYSNSTTLPPYMLCALLAMLTLALPLLLPPFR